LKQDETWPKFLADINIMPIYIESQLFMISSPS